MRAESGLVFWRRGRRADRFQALTLASISLGRLVLVTAPRKMRIWVAAQGRGDQLAGDHPQGCCGWRRSPRSRAPGSRFPGGNRAQGLRGPAWVRRDERVCQQVSEPRKGERSDPKRKRKSSPLSGTAGGVLFEKCTTLIPPWDDALSASPPPS